MSKIAKYLEELHKTSKSKGNLIFRGVPDSNWPIQSSAARRMKEKSNQFDFIQYHVNLIENARKNHFIDTKHDYDKIHDLEILAEIQHLGGATCLTDFTTNFLIALWFASINTTEKEKINGKIFVIDIVSDDNEDKLYTYKIKKEEDETIDQILTKPRKYIDFKKNNDPRCWIWEPTMLNNRIIKQDSVFVFGLPVIDNTTLATLEPIEIDYKDKEDIIRELDLFFNVTNETIFHDLAGFSAIANKVNAPISNGILQDQSCFKNGKAYFKMEKYEMAEEFFLNAINCHGENKDCNKTDNCCNAKDKRELFYWKGLCNLQSDKGIQSKALIDFDEAIKCKSENYSFLKGTFRKKLSLLYDMKMYDEAIKISEEFLTIYPQPENYDFYFAALELSILTNGAACFEEYYSKIENEELLRVGNKELLFYYFFSIGEIVFKQTQSEKIDTIVNEFFTYISEFEKQQKQEEYINLENSLEQFTWNFSDMLSWADNRSNKDKIGILTMTQRMQNMLEQLQNKLLYREKFTATLAEK